MKAWSVERANEGSVSSGWPRVVILHSFYRSELPSGENATVERQFGLLAERGVDVSLLSVKTDDLERRTAHELRAALGVATGGGLSPEEQLRQLNPEIVHIHNLFPNISTHWLAHATVPIVTTLHNYRPLCAAATLSREGRDCTLCVKGSSINGLRHACYRGSRMATLPLTLRSLGGPTHDPVLRHSDLLLAPSETVQRVYQSAGAERLRILLQPTSDRGPVQPFEMGGRLLFLGRLTPDKGILELLSVWPNDAGLNVIGQGPLEPEARTLALERGLDVEFLGRVSDESLAMYLRSSRALVFPSTWREGAPAVYAEALSAGLPVIAVAGNSVSESVVCDGTGVVLANLTEDDLRGALEFVDEHSDVLKVHCSEVYSLHFTVSAWAEGLLTCYREAVRHHGGSS